jgi:hypothetical protein
VSLDIWDAPDHLYLARTDEVSPYRPFFTGDVFDDLAIPGVQHEGAAIIIAHPCAMRGKNARLLDKVLVASVESHQKVPAHKWADGYYDRMPLPDLQGAGTAFEVAWLERLGRAERMHLLAAKRIACLSSVGVNLLQQRTVFHLTRVDIPTAKIWEAFSHTYEEAELLEEWTEALAASGVTADDAAQSFETWIRQENRQERLRDPQARAPIRAEMRRTLRNQGVNGMQ